MTTRITIITALFVSYIASANPTQPIWSIGDPKHEYGAFVEIDHEDYLNRSFHHFSLYPMMSTEIETKTTENNKKHKLLQKVSTQAKKKKTVYNPIHQIYKKASQTITHSYSSSAL